MNIATIKMNNTCTLKKFAVSLLAASATILFGHALPVRSLPQWVTIEGENGSNLQYDYNSLKSLSNGIKSIDIYQPSIKSGHTLYMSCINWKFSVAGGHSWEILPPGSKIEELAYKICSNKQSNTVKKETRTRSNQSIFSIKDATNYLNSGNAKHRAGDNHGAIADYSQAIIINPSNAVYYYNRGIAKDDLGNKSGAVMDYSKAIAINPREENYYYNRAIARNALGDKLGAISDYSLAIAINAKEADFYFNRGTVKDDISDEKGAIKDYSQAIAIDPQYAKAYINRGYLRLELGDAQGAISDYSQAIDIDPQNTTAHYNRGYTKVGLGDKVGACSDYKKAAALGDNSASEWLQSKERIWCRNML